MERLLKKPEKNWTLSLRAEIQTSANNEQILNLLLYNHKNTLDSNMRTPKGCVIKILLVTVRVVFVQIEWLCNENILMTNTNESRCFLAISLPVHQTDILLTDWMRDRLIAMDTRSNQSKAFLHLAHASCDSCKRFIWLVKLNYITKTSSAARWSCFASTRGWVQIGRCCSLLATSSMLARAQVPNKLCNVLSLYMKAAAWTKPHANKSEREVSCKINKMVSTTCRHERQEIQKQWHLNTCEKTH